MTSKSDEKPILDIQSLTCGYKDKTILQNLSFSISRGEMVTILGTNGSGKTTLLKTIAGTLPPQGGTFYLRGMRPNALSLKSLSREIAVVMQFQEAACMTVQEYVLLGRLPYFKKFQFFETREDLKIVHRFLKLTRTFKLKDMQFNELSGGEKQLVAIARALVQEPALILLDEPTSHLDISHQVRIMDLISEMKKELGLAVLAVIHDLNLASEYTDKVVLIDGNAGTLHICGDPSHVITAPSVEAVFGTPVIVGSHPVSGKPSVFISH